MQERLAKLAFAGSLLRQSSREAGEEGVGMWVPCGGPGALQEASGFLRLPQGGVVGPTASSPSPLSSKNPLRSHRAPTRPTRHPSPASSPIKTYDDGTHSLPPLNHLPLQRAGIPFRKSRQHFTAQASCSKAAASRKKKREGSQNIKNF